MALYLYSRKRNEQRRPSNYKDYICGRCRQGFDEAELKPIWQFPTAPLRIMGWNNDKEMDLCYCLKCRNLLNVFMHLSLVITVPVVFIFMYVLFMYLGLVSE